MEFPSHSKPPSTWQSGCSDFNAVSPSLQALSPQAGHLMDEDRKQARLFNGQAFNVMLLIVMGAGISGLQGFREGLTC